MQEKAWENEYRNPKLVSLSDEPAKCVKNFARFLRKEEKIELSNLRILDLGCGNGKNSFYIADQGHNNKIVGIDISETALKYASELASSGRFIKGNIGEKMDFQDASFDIILDVTTSNSLNESERKIYLNEIQRLLKSGGYLFVRALNKDGDKNAKNLLEKFPGKEKDTYIMPEVGHTERVFTKEDFLELYSPNFTLLYLDKETHYTKFEGQSYKRNFWVSAWKNVI